MYQDADALEPLVREILLALLTERRDRSRNGFIQAQIENVKILWADGGVRLARQRGHNLADVAVAVHDLPESKAASQELLAMESCTIVDLRVGVGFPNQTQPRSRRGDTQSIHQLTEK